ncbi:MAG: class I tRNA ligase family protein [Thermoplasmata archaeon]|nr:class I tRNA ligase family protein [Thermoplasmata archaeon]
MLPLVLRDSLSGETRPVSQRPGTPLTMYVCGPTVNDRAHVGHGRTYLYFDLVRRFLRDQGVPVLHVMNITDFEDKITARAISFGLSWRQLARQEARRFHADLAALRLLPPDRTPWASQFVPEMIEIIRRLQRKGGVHREGDSWYYTPPVRDPRNFPVGRELAAHAVPEPGQSLEALDSVKQDFLAWRNQEKPAASWPSPWGAGAPGWHLECFAMAEEILGIPVDLHGGGIDLVFPHHYAENEIALALHDSLFSRHFLHTAFVTEAGQKMSKSRGNLVPLREAIDTHGADAVRWYLASEPFHRRLDWATADFDRAAVTATHVTTQVRESLEPGAGGSLSVGALATVVEDVARLIGDGLQAEEAMLRISTWSEALARHPRGRFPRGDRLVAKRLYRRLGRLTGLALE